jgi:hypothetical protein
MTVVTESVDPTGGAERSIKPSLITRSELQNDSPLDRTGD